MQVWVMGKVRFEMQLAKLSLPGEPASKQAEQKVALVSGSGKGG